MNLELDLDFKKHFDPDNFFFGVANAPYLCEGGYNTPDGIKNSYVFMENNEKHERSGQAVRFWSDYEDQIKLAASLGLNAFRMGIDWSRVQPSTSTQPHSAPEWDLNAVDHYAEIVATVIKYKMQPIITLHHFTHPAWLGLEMWLGDEGPDLLAEYQMRIVQEVNDRLVRKVGAVMKHFLVYNEPGLVPLIYFRSDIFPIQRKGPQYIVQAYDNMFSRYMKVYDGIYELFERKGWGAPHVGVTSASMCVYEFDKITIDLLRLRSFGVKERDVSAKIAELRDDWNRRIGVLAKSKLTDEQYQRYLDLVAQTGEYFKPSALPKTMTALYASKRSQKLDYISVNVYDPFGAVKFPTESQEQTKWWEFTADGELYHTFIRAYNEFNKDLPFYMGENSIAYEQPIGKKARPRPDGWNRERYLKTYLMEMIKCMKEGVPIKGYLYWSLVDDYEWQDGYPPRLGLYNYDYENHKINSTDGLGDPAGEIYAGLIRALRSGEKDRIAKTFTNTYSHWLRK